MVEDASYAADALEQYRSGYDFSDAFIAGRNTAAKCDTTLTFDKKAARLDGFTLLTSDDA